MNMALEDGHFCKGGKLIPTLQFRRKLAHEMTENTSGGENVDYGRTRRSTCTTSIVDCTFMKVKKHEGSYDRKAKKFKKSQTGISKTEMRQL